jgi:hypothetical protein
MVKTADLGDRDHLPCLLDGARYGRILREREMCTALVVVREVRLEDAAEVVATGADPSAVKVPTGSDAVDAQLTRSR